MITHTKAFLQYRKLSQSHLNFVVLVCHAVPSLLADLLSSGPTVTHPPDHFKAHGNPKSEVARFAQNYQEELARLTTEAVFSYFEAYIKEVLLEVVSFHGGGDKLRKLARVRNSKFISNTHASIKSEKRKLQDNPTPSKLEKYKKYARSLDSKGYRFPTDLFSHYGIFQLLPKIADNPRTGMRAWEIPNILAECLLFDLADCNRYCQSGS